MDNTSAQIQHLQMQLDLLTRKHAQFSTEIDLLNEQIQILKNSTDLSYLNLNKSDISDDPLSQNIPSAFESTSPELELVENAPAVEVPDIVPSQKKAKTTSSLEKFIGENLINKIGILITVIGVAIGAKYSIENDLISPLTRIILGYAAGAALLGIGIKLKSKYLNYSAVLVSGAIAILYFITFFAYSFYELIPNLPAFGLMFIFTAFTIFTSLKYDKQIIAHIGLVGAYAIPLLLSDGSGRVEIMLTYMAIINVGILILSFKKYWKSLFYSAFAFTWIFVISWFFSSFDFNKQWTLATTIISIFFATFYICFLAYKILKKEKIGFWNVAVLLINSFIFYGLGVSLVSHLNKGADLLGLFTLCNALIHFGVSAAIYKQKMADRNLFYLISGLVLVFITLSVPVQLNGNWVTLIWAGEAALLFWIGRTKAVPVYEKLSYVLMAIATFSLLQDWTSFYNGYQYEEIPQMVPAIFNIMFLTSLLFTGCFGFIYYILNQKKYISNFTEKGKFSTFMKFFIPGILIGISYFALRMEIENYWDQLYEISTKNLKNINTSNYSLINFKEIWLINYTLLFFSLLSFLNMYKLRSNTLANVSRVILIIAVAVFLTLGLLSLSELRESYLQPAKSKYFPTDLFYIAIRYLSYAFLVLSIFVLYLYNRKEFVKQKYPKLLDGLIHICILWVASSELIHWLDLGGYQNVYKLGLTILWGVYAMLIIALGIWKKKQYFRIAGIALFGITLIKLFIYDISELGSGSKTILFVILGALLLLISFLYNKYKTLIFGEDEPQDDKNIKDEDEK